MSARDHGSLMGTPECLFTPRSRKAWQGPVKTSAFASSANFIRPFFFFLLWIDHDYCMCHITTVVFH